MKNHTTGAKYPSLENFDEFGDIAYRTTNTASIFEEELSYTTPQVDKSADFAAYKDFDPEDYSFWSGIKRYTTGFWRFLKYTPKRTLWELFVMCWILSMDDFLTPIRTGQVFSGSQFGTNIEIDRTSPDLFGKFLLSPAGIVLLIIPMLGTAIKFAYCVHQLIGCSFDTNVGCFTKGFANDKDETYGTKFAGEDLRPLCQELNELCDESGLEYQFAIHSVSNEQGKYDLKLLRKPPTKRKSASQDQQQNKWGWLTSWLYNPTPIKPDEPGPAYSRVDRLVHGVYNSKLAKYIVAPIWDWLGHTSFVYWVIWYGVFVAASFYGIGAMNIIGISTAVLTPPLMVAAIAGVVVLPFVIGAIYLGFKIPYYIRQFHREKLDQSDQKQAKPITPMERIEMVKLIAQMRLLRHASERVLGERTLYKGEIPIRKGKNQNTNRISVSDLAAALKLKYPPKLALSMPGQVFINDDDDWEDPRFNDAISAHPLRDDTSEEYRKSRVSWAAVKGFLTGFVVTNFVGWVLAVAAEGGMVLGAMALAKLGIISAATAATYTIGATFTASSWMMAMGGVISVSALPFTGVFAIGFLTFAALVGLAVGTVYAIDMRRTIKERDFKATQNASTRRFDLEQRAEKLKKRQKEYVNQLAAVRKIAKDNKDEGLLDLVEALPQKNDITLDEFKKVQQPFTNKFDRYKGFKQVAIAMKKLHLVEFWNGFRKAFSGMLLVRFTVLSIVPALFISSAVLAGYGAFTATLPLVGVATIPPVLIGLAFLGVTVGLAWWWMEAKERQLETNIYEMAPEALYLRSLELKAQEEIMDRLEQGVTPSLSVIVENNTPPPQNVLSSTDRMKKRLGLDPKLSVTENVTQTVSEQLASWYGSGSHFIGRLRSSLFAGSNQAEGSAADPIGAFNKDDYPQDSLYGL
ncbi:MAG: hypothetical protein AB7F64_05280 [Gammaproteobacteria bacterium]